MLRTLVIGVLGLALCAGVAYNLGLFPLSPEPVRTIDPQPRPIDLSTSLYQVISADGVIEPPSNKVDEDSISFSGQLSVYNRLEVTAMVEGTIQSVGEEIPIGAQLVGGIAPFLPDPCYVSKVKYQVMSGDQWVDQEVVHVYRRLMKGDIVEMDQVLATLNTVKAITEKRTKIAKVSTASAEERAAALKSDLYRTIYEQQLRLEPGRAVSPQELAISRATWLSYTEEARAKGQAVAEAQSNLDQAQVYLSQHSLVNQLPTRLALIKDINKERGEGVKPGDKIMELQSLDRFTADGMLEVQYFSRVQDRTKLRATVIPSQEEAPLGRPLKIHRAEVNSVAFTNRGLNADDLPLVVSGSEDRSIRLWDRRFSAPLDRQYQFKDPVRVVACSPQGAAHNLILVGCSDGSIYLCDLDNKQQKTPVKIPSEQGHGEAITSLAFSPDGNFFASGSESAAINLWNLQAIRTRLAIRQISARIKSSRVWSPSDETRSSVEILAKNDDAREAMAALQAGDVGKAAVELDRLYNDLSGKELVYPFDADHGVTNAHYGSITSLHFTPQCRLVSASRDNTVRVWDLKQKGVEPVGFPIQGRDGHVSQLGVTSDGNFMLFDQGKTLQILSVDDGRTVNTLQTPGNTVDFQTTAIFSPDSKLMLTAGAAEGRLQLWSTPSGGSRGFEVRQFVTDERSPVSCAAFAPATPAGSTLGSLAVSGTKDGFVYLWPIPSAEEVHKHPIRDLTLTTVYPAVDPSSRHIRLSVEVRNQPTPQFPQGRLVPGRSVTIVLRNAY